MTARLEKYLRIQFNTEGDDADQAVLMIKGKSYRLLRTGKKPQWPKPGYASVLTEVEKDLLRRTNVPIGNLIDALQRGTWGESIDLIVLHDKDWRQLRKLAKRHFRVIEGGALGEKS